MQTPLVALASNIIGNWLGNILWRQLGLENNPITKVLLPVIIGSILMYGLYQTAKNRLKKMPDNWPAINEGNKYLISQGAIFSLVTAMYSWCGEEFSSAHVSALLISLVPYAQGVLETNLITHKLDRLYMTAHNILEMFSENNYRIRQNWVEERLRQHPIVQELDEHAQRRFAAYKMRLWAHERGDVDITVAPNGQLIAEIRAVPDHPQS